MGLGAVGLPQAGPAWRFSPAIILLKTLTGTSAVSARFLLASVIINWLTQESFIPTLAEKAGEWIFSAAKNCREDFWTLFLLWHQFNTEVNCSLKLDPTYICILRTFFFLKTGICQPKKFLCTQQPLFEWHLLTTKLPSKAVYLKSPHYQISLIYVCANFSEYFYM